MNNSLESEYALLRNDILVPVAERLENLLSEYCSSLTRIDRIYARAKTGKSFLKKAEKTNNENTLYDDPLNQIQDQIGARIIVFYLSDVEHITKLVLKYFREIEKKDIIPEKESEFGYFGRHFILFLPTDVFTDDTEQSRSPKHFELQIKTLYQHAWSEAEHDLGYKEFSPLTSVEKRKIAFTAAQSWGADTIFDDLFTTKTGQLVEDDDNKH